VVIIIIIIIFSLAVTVEALRGNIDCKLAFLKGVSQFQSNFHLVGDVPREPFLHGSVNAVQLCR